MEPAPFQFQPADFQKISAVFGVEPQTRETHTRFVIHNQETGLQVNIEIYNGIQFGDADGVLINVYTNYGIHQLHRCSGYVASDLLGEAIFFAEQADTINAIVIEKTGGYSVYSNVRKELINSDFSEMSPEIMMTGVSLSLIEPLLDGGVLPDLEDDDESA